MFTEQFARSLVIVLLHFGIEALLQPQGNRGFGVWLEQAGLLLQSEDDVKGFLTLLWVKQQRESEMPTAAEQLHGEAVLDFGEVC